MLETFKDRFTAIGFEIEPFGGDEYAARAIPDRSVWNRQKGTAS